MTRQKLSQVLSGYNWSNSWPTTTVRDAEGFVEIEVRNIATKFTKLGIANHGVGVRAIDVNLTAGSMHKIAYLDYCLFVNTVC